MNTALLKLILKDPNGVEENIWLYNYLEKSASSDFYAIQFSNTEAIQKPSPPNYSLVPTEMKEALDFLSESLSKDAIVVELGGGKFQQRSGYPNHKFKNYLPLDISYTSIKGYVDSNEKFGIVADATKLPFKDQSIDAIFTHTFLEHPLDPNQVLLEIFRVIKPGGYIVHSDAWNCRWWQRFGVVGVKPVSDMSIFEGLIWLASRITEFKLIRFPRLVLQRLVRIIFLNRARPVKLSYRKLNPNYNLHLYKDEDAASSIDPIDVMNFYESRGCSIILNSKLFSRIFFRSRNVFIKKS